MADRPPSLLARLDQADAALSRRIAIDAEEKARRTPRYWAAFVGAHLGDSWVWGLITAWLWRKAVGQAEPARSRRTGLLTSWLITLGAIYAITLGIKQVVKRERPGTGTLMYAGGADVHSFPSGHATRMGAILAWFSAIFPGAALLAWPLTLWVSWGRVAMGVHYAGDVLVGLIVGFVTGKIARRITERK